MDDGTDVGDVLAEALRLDGHRVETVHSGAAALNRLLATSYDLVFSEMKMPGMNGIEIGRASCRERV